MELAGLVNSPNSDGVGRLGRNLRSKRCTSDKLLTGQTASVQTVMLRTPVVGLGRSRGAFRPPRCGSPVKMDLNKHLYRQSVRMVRAVGIELTT